MKRHDSLLLVAREHHESLVIARRLVTGRASAGSDWPDSPAAQAQALAQFHERHLRRHFAAEEQAVFPAAREIGAEAMALAERLAAEHRQMSAWIGELAADAAVDAAALAAFGELLNAHVRLEDRQFFPMLETGLEPARLLRLQADLEALYR